MLYILTIYKIQHTKLKKKGVCAHVYTHSHAHNHSSSQKIKANVLDYTFPGHFSVDPPNVLGSQEARERDVCRQMSAGLLPPARIRSAVTDAHVR